MDAFEITKIGAGSHRIVVEGDSTCYVVEGDERAAVIDTGIAMGKRLMPAVRSVTSRPVVLVLTHAHIDHMHHMDEFDTVYLCHEEFKLPPDFLREHMAGKDLNLAGTRHIETGSRIDLGAAVWRYSKSPGTRREALCCGMKRRTICTPATPSAAGRAFGCSCPGAPN